MSGAEVPAAIEKVAADLAACYGKQWDSMDDYEKGTYLEPLQTMVSEDQDDDPCCEECWAWRTGEVGR